MLCERVLGNVESEPGWLAGRQRVRDELDVQWWELRRRALRKTTRGGRSVRILLPLGQSLKQGDVVFDDGSTLVTVCVAQSEVFVAVPGGIEALALACLDLGNLHVPVQLSGAELWVAPDGPAEAALRGLGVKFELQMRRFCPRFCPGMPEVALAPDLRIGFEHGKEV